VSTSTPDPDTCNDGVANLEHPTIRGWATTLMDERRELWESRGRAEEEREGLQGLTVGCKVDGASVNGSASH
jgi:hypothetical protein